MYFLTLQPQFERNLRKFLMRHPDMKYVVEEKLDILRKNPADPGLKLHKLTGKLSGCWAVSILYDYRLVFAIEKNFIVLLAIGTHDEVY